MNRSSCPCTVSARVRRRGTVAGGVSTVFATMRDELLVRRAGVQFAAATVVRWQSPNNPRVHCNLFYRPIITTTAAAAGNNITVRKIELREHVHVYIYVYTVYVLCQYGPQRTPSSTPPSATMPFESRTPVRLKNLHFPIEFRLCAAPAVN